MKTIFVVDNSDTTLVKVEKALELRYRVMTIPSVVKMFALLEKIKPDLILLDIELPEINGFKAMELLKDNEAYADIPVIFLTGHTDSDNESRGFELGAVDFITKPFSELVLLNRVKTHLDINEIVRERTEQLRQLQNSLVSVMADMVESRDKMTQGHIERIMGYVKILIKAMDEKGLYANEMRDWDFDSIVSASRLHDIGNVVISDVILNKHDRLTETEYDIVKTHPEKGERIIERMAAQTGDVEFLHNARMFAGFHHEHWDGSGYPHGLKGTDIPLQGRILVIADIYDALISERSYKMPFSDEEVISTIKAGSGTIFDPEITKVFLEVKHKFKELEQCRGQSITGE